MEMTHAFLDRDHAVAPADIAARHWREAIMSRPATGYVPRGGAMREELRLLGDILRSVFTIQS